MRFSVPTSGTVRLGGPMPSPKPPSPWVGGPGAIMGGGSTGGGMRRTGSGYQGAMEGVDLARPSHFKKGGKVKKTGMAKVHKGEVVLTASRAKKVLGKKSVKSAKGKAKVKKTMGEFGKGKLHSGSKSGPKVTNRRQAVAIALNQARRKA